MKADKEMESGFEDNLIIEAGREYTPKPKEGRPANQKKRSLTALIPAIPIRIVASKNEESTESKPVKTALLKN